jgi:hypothetical protein
MWEYNYTLQNNELTHHGILGMKWGVRRYQRRNGSLTQAGKNRYYERDKYMFGKRGADRIEKRQSEGKSRNYSVNVERARQLTTGLLSTAALSTISYLATSGKGAALVSKGSQAVKNMMDSRFDSMILDASGKVIKKYRGSIKDVSDTITALAVR